MNFSKKYLIFFFVLFLSYKSYTTNFTSFMGIPFGISKDKVCKMMIEKGWILKNPLSLNDYYFSGRQYAGKDIQLITISFDYDDNFNSVRIEFINIPEDTNEVFNAIINKYNFKQSGKAKYITEDSNFSIINGGDYIFIEDLRKTQKPKNNTNIISTIETDI